MMRKLLLGLGLALLAVFPLLAHASFDHSAWDSLLRRHVHDIANGTSTQVDYAAMAQERATLKRYLDALAAVPRVQFDSWRPAEQLAFLINAYNAWTVELVLSRYPDLASIKDLGSLLQSPWKKRFIPLLGETRSLDNLEHGLIRGSERYAEPRIHFAVNCASIGCPALRAEAYAGDKLDAQLADATRAFLADRSRNRLEGERLRVSLIFKWYREDFDRARGSLGNWLAEQAPALGLAETQAAKLKSNAMSIDFLDYDWRLNHRAGSTK